MPANKPLAALLLAAGRSRRFGSNKLATVITINGQQKPLLLHTLDNWLAAFDRLYLMLPADDNLLLSLINALPTALRSRIITVTVSHPEDGMSQSLQAGITASEDAAGWLIGLADMPWVTPPVLIALKQAMATGAKIAAPYYHGVRGQPVGVHADYKEALRAVSGDQGARQLLKAAAEQIVAIETADDGILRDIDSPADLPDAQAGRTQSLLNSR